MRRWRERVCPRCMASGAHAMGCQEPAIRRAEASVLAVLAVKPRVLADALVGIPEPELELLAEVLRVAIERQREVNRRAGDPIDGA